MKVFIKKPMTNAACDMKEHTRYKSPVDNLLYGILLQALADNDIEYLKHVDGQEIWGYLRKQKEQ